MECEMVPKSVDCMFENRKDGEVLLDSSLKPFKRIPDSVTLETGTLFSITSDDCFGSAISILNAKLGKL